VVCMRKRGFEVVKGFENKDINLPKRQTKNAAGYDFESAEPVTIEPIWKHLYDLFKKKAKGEEIDDTILKPALVPTGVKSYMQPDEVLYLYNRSGNPLKKFLLLGNGAGVVDSDYEGEIKFQFINFGFRAIKINKNERIGQGVFSTFLKADGDQAGGERGEGGFGSTGS